MYRIYRKIQQKGRDVHLLVARYTFIEPAREFLAAEADAGRANCWLQYEPEALSRLARCPIPLRRRGRVA